MRRNRILRAAGLVVVIVGGAMWLPLVEATPASSAIGPPTPHLAVIVMENKAYSKVVGNGVAPYINDTLIPAGRLFTQYYAVAHPSLPNYLVLTSGQYQGCVTDSCPRSSVISDNLFAQMNQATLPVSWKVYAEDMPSSCYLNNAGAYAVRHNPPPYYASLGATGDNSCASDDVPYSRLAADISAGALPQFTMIVPNLYHDMHTDQKAPPCQLGSTGQNTVCQGDAWLRSNVPPLLSDGGLNDVTVLLVFDEGSGSAGGGGQVAVVEIGPNACMGCTEPATLNHYGLVNAIEQWFGLPQLHPGVPTL